MKAPVTMATEYVEMPKESRRLRSQSTSYASALAPEPRKRRGLRRAPSRVRKCPSGSGAREAHVVVVGFAGLVVDQRERAAGVVARREDHEPDGAFPLLQFTR